MSEGFDTDDVGNPQIWTPAEKLPDAVKKMAWHLFLKRWEKASSEVTVEGHAEMHRHCVEVAQVVFKNENPSSEVPT